jgi:hypothetical protein
MTPGSPDEVQALDETDELFLVLDGQLPIDLEGAGSIVLRHEASLTVPSRIVHRIRAPTARRSSCRSRGRSADGSSGGRRGRRSELVTDAPQIAVAHAARLELGARATCGGRTGVSRTRARRR